MTNASSQAKVCGSSHNVMNLKVEYSDETSTGELRQDLRDLRRVTIAARCAPDHNGFEWIKRFRTDFCGRLSEVKSMTALSICANNPRARDFLIRHVSESVIFVIDLFEELYNTLSFLRDIAPDPQNAVKSLMKSGVIPQELMTDILLDSRKRALMKSVAPHVQRLVDWTGIRDKDGNPVSVLDDIEINRLNAKEFTELITRFNVAFAEVCDPKRRADAISRCIFRSLPSNYSYIAATTLKATQQRDLMFDKGTKRALGLLNEANEVVENAIEAVEMQSHSFKRNIEHGDSEEVLGVQAADFAAGYARSVFERVYEGSTTDAAKTLREEFSRVVLNDQWLD